MAVIFLLIVLAVFIISASLYGLKQFKIEERAVIIQRDIRPLINQAKELIESDQNQKARDILESSLAQISSEKKELDVSNCSVIKELHEDINALLDRMEQEEKFYQKIENHIGGGIKDLAMLRSKGMISEHEFEAFSERFKVSTGEKARSIIRAISDLHMQYNNGAMSEGNYHAGLWSLLDKLDRKT